MKLLKNLKISKKNQLRKYIFAYIVAILFCLLCVFLFFGNLNNIWRSLMEKDELEVDQRAEYKETVRLSQKIGDQAEDKEKERTEGDIIIWGQENGYKVAARQLENMKERFREEENLTECGDARILFVCRTSFEEPEIELLRQYNEAGMTLFFTDIPGDEALKKESVRNLMGIKRYEGIEKKTGIRLTEKLLFGSVTEKKERLYLKSVKLMQQTEVYGSALEKEKTKVENLSPVFWRYKKSKDSGNVYVTEGHLMNETIGYSVVSFLFEDLYQVYMYPIVNAYCFAISGMPYSEDFSSDFLYSEYERDSLGVQNDIFFPEFKRCEERYEAASTWYSPDKKSLQAADSVLLQYYLEGIEEKKDEIGTAGIERSVESPFQNKLAEWTPSFSWIEEGNGSVCLPYNVIKDKTYDNVVFNNLGLCKGTGFNTVYADVRSFLYEPEKKNEDDWIDFCRSMETVLGTEKERIDWLERITVGEAIYRIKAFSMMEPDIEYSDTEVEADIGNFTGKAYFYLSLEEEIKTVENARLTKLCDGFYMVEATGEHVRIVYEEKER